MSRPPWAPLNAGVFLIILGGVIIISFLGLTDLFRTAFPLILTLFGVWLVVEAFVIPPENEYAPPRTMVVGWGALIAGLGVLWYVGVTSVALLPATFAVILILAGIAVVGYSFTRASPAAKTS